MNYYWIFKPFATNDPILYPLKSPKNLCFSGDLGGALDSNGWIIKSEAGVVITFYSLIECHSNMHLWFSYLWGHSFRTYANFSEKLTFLTPWYAHCNKRSHKMCDLLVECAYHGIWIVSFFENFAYVLNESPL